LYELIFDYIYNVSLKEKLSYSFGSSLDELTQIGKDEFEIMLNSDSAQVSISSRRNNLSVINKRKLNVSFQIIYDESSMAVARFYHEYEDDGRKLYKLVYNEKLLENNIESIRKESRFNYLFYAIIFVLAAELETSFPSASCYYLPAARSNLVQGYKTQLSNMAKDLQLSVINPSDKIEIPSFSGVVIDFISTMNDFKIEKGHFDSLIKQIEKDLIHGEIVTEDLEKSANRQIYYKYQGRNIPLHRASSAISELAPVILYIKYILKNGDILIIEEPEAHLHPENQRILAKFSVRLVRKGVSLIITTHSDYLLKQLNTFILLSKISPEKRVKRYKYAKNDYINLEEVAAYSFTRDKKTGYKIEHVEINCEEGISQSEFIKIYKILYDESVKLQRDLNELKENGSMP
jgi:predicted ATPase